MIRYPIQNWSVLETFLLSYNAKLISTGTSFGIDLTSQEFVGDHLGVQVMSVTEFDVADKDLRSFCELTHDEIIHQRRNRVYKFNVPAPVNGITFQGIEIFEPKPGADVSTLRPGIEHAAFTVHNLDLVVQHLRDREIGIAKDATYSRGRFIKTALLNGIELEFREQTLI